MYWKYTGYYVALLKVWEIAFFTSGKDTQSKRRDGLQEEKLNYQSQTWKNDRQSSG